MISDIEYITQDEIEAHEAAMQRVVEDEKRERKAINDKKKRAIEAAQKAFNETVRVNSAAKDNKEVELAAM